MATAQLLVMTRVILSLFTIFPFAVSNGNYIEFVFWEKLLNCIIAQYDEWRVTEIQPKRIIQHLLSRLPHSECLIIQREQKYIHASVIQPHVVSLWLWILEHWSWPFVSNTAQHVSIMLPPTRDASSNRMLHHRIQTQQLFECPTACSFLSLLCGC